MKKIFYLLLLLIFGITLYACDDETTTLSITTNTTSANLTTVSELSESEIYQLLIEAEELSGMQSWNGKLISESGSLNLPSAYRGVTITYSSRNEDIISNDGYVTLPDECWIESRDQDGVTERPNLNDNWPIVVDVTMTYGNQTRTAKLMFIVAPAEGFTCDKYKG